MPKRTTIGSWFEDLVALCFPDLCVCCNNNLYRGETLICMKCLHRLPKNDMHYEKGNILEKKFWGKADVERVTSFLRYIKKSDVQRLINKLKYKGEKEIGVFLGKYAAAELVDNDVFGSVDVIVPVPLHESKYRKRGYNQSRCIADGMAEIMGIPVDEGNLYRAVENPTQTRKSTYERWYFRAYRRFSFRRQAYSARRRCTYDRLYSDSLCRGNQRKMQCQDFGLYVGFGLVRSASKKAVMNLPLIYPSEYCRFLIFLYLCNLLDRNKFIVK